MAFHIIPLICTDIAGLKAAMETLKPIFVEAHLLGRYTWCSVHNFGNTTSGTNPGIWEVCMMCSVVCAGVLVHVSLLYVRGTCIAMVRLIACRLIRPGMAVSS